MSILIKGMDMPKSCEECKFESAQYVNNYCRRAFCSLGADYEHCPLIEIVRCGECKWWDRKDKESPFGYCHAEKHCHFSNNWEISIYRTYKADHFCSDGERRADEHTD